MKIPLVGVLALLAATPFAGASIIGAEAADDGDGAVVCVATWDGDTSTMNVDGVQNWWPGHVLGTVTTDTELDPIMWVRNTITNSADVLPLVWTDFHINLSMNKTYTFLAATTLPSWTANYTQPTYDSGTGKWIGQVDYVMGSGGSSVNVGDDGQFDYRISFLGSIAYCQEMIPTPEPGSLLLLSLGGLLIRRRQ